MAVSQTLFFRFSASVLVLAILLAGCTPPPDSAYYNRGDPESLLDVSSEVVNLGVGNQGKLAELSGWIAKDQPTRAELYCQAGEPRCNEARKVLELNAVPTVVVPSNDYSVALVYERILARDCNSRFIDNTHDEYNAAHPASGCSVAANMVQQVSDKQEFVNPNLSDMPSATGAASVYTRAYTPRTEPIKEYGVSDSLAAKASAGSGN